jgi:hypothetical protein
MGMERKNRKVRKKRWQKFWMELSPSGGGGQARLQVPMGRMGKGIMPGGLGASPEKKVKICSKVVACGVFLRWVWHNIQAYFI